MGNLKHLIIGAGPAGLSAAQAIRERDGSAEITLVTREEVEPYSPAMLPYRISDELARADLFAKGHSLLERMQVKFALGKQVTAIAPDAVTFADGQKESFDRLLIASGAHPLVPAVASGSSDRVHTFRTFRDCARLEELLAAKQEVAICGGGLVAVELAEKLSRAGHTVTIIELKASLVPLYFSPKGIACVEQAFRRHGVKILTGTTLNAVKQVANHLELTLSSGETLRADRLVVAIGVAPTLPQGCALETAGGGLKVGANMATSMPNVYAAGDVAAPPSFLDGHHAPCPILPEAVLQGRVAGANMAGETLEYKGWIRSNFLRCFEDNLFSIGDAVSSDPACTVVEHEEGGSVLRLVVKDGLLRGAEGVNLAAVHPGIFVSLIREQFRVSDSQNLLLSKPREAAGWLMQRQRRAQAL